MADLLITLLGLAGCLCMVALIIQLIGVIIYLVISGIRGLIKEWRNK